MDIITITDPNHPLLFRLTARIMQKQQSILDRPPQTQALTHWLDSTRDLPRYWKWPNKKKLFEIWLEWWKLFPPLPREQDIRQFLSPLPTWRETHQQWRAILNSFGHLYYDPIKETIYTCTPNITLFISGENDEYDVGRFHVGVKIKESSPLQSYTHSCGNADHPHPHLYYNRDCLCLGTAEVKEQLYLQRGLIFPLWLLLYQQLKEFNPHSQVNALESEEEEEARCDSCGHTGDLSTCERCGTYLCEDCQSICGYCGPMCEEHFHGYCNDCGKGYCTRHGSITDCQICKRPFCGDCYNECDEGDCSAVTCDADSKSCTSCGNNYCPEHIKEYVVNFVRDLYCSNCIENLKERKEADGSGPISIDEVVPTPHYVAENQIPLPLG